MHRKIYLIFKNGDLTYPGVFDNAYGDLAYTISQLQEMYGPLHIVNFIFWEDNPAWIYSNENHYYWIIENNLYEIKS